jgi:hypothetical protein
MAYLAANLSKIAQLGQNNQMWEYQTTDALAVVDSASYFTGDAINMLRVGDIVFVKTVAAVGVSKLPTAAGIMVVSANNGTVVDLNDAVSILGSDTD